MGADRSRAGGWVGGAGFPAEDKSNNYDMTLPKANLALLRDDLSGFSTPHVLLRVEALV